MPKKVGRPGKKVRVVELDEVYQSLQGAAKAVKGNQSAISRVLSGERKSHKGYSYEYVE